MSLRDLTNTFTSNRPCRVCGGTLRYLKDKSCQACRRQKSKARSTLSEGYGAKAKNSDSREQARKAGEKTYVTSTTCRKSNCNSSIRYTANADCVECTKRRVRTSRAEEFNSRKQNYVYFIGPDIAFRKSFDNIKSLEKSDKAEDRNLAIKLRELNITHGQHEIQVKSATRVMKELITPSSVDEKIENYYHSTKGRLEQNPNNPYFFLDHKLAEAAKYLNGTEGDIKQFYEKNDADEVLELLKESERISQNKN